MEGPSHAMFPGRHVALHCTCPASEKVANFVRSVGCCQPQEPWCGFCQLLQSFPLGLFSRSLWQLSLLTHIDLLLPCSKEGLSAWAPAVNTWGGSSDMHPKAQLAASRKARSSSQHLGLVSSVGRRCNLTGEDAAKQFSCRG